MTEPKIIEITDMNDPLMAFLRSNYGNTIVHCWLFNTNKMSQDLTPTIYCSVLYVRRLCVPTIGQQRHD